jgi:hypothetical protein
MICYDCGNEESFTMLVPVAYWDRVTNKWITDIQNHKIICNECGSFDVRQG